MLATSDINGILRDIKYVWICIEYADVRLNKPDVLSVVSEALGYVLSLSTEQTGKDHSFNITIN